MGIIINARYKLASLQFVHSLELMLINILIVKNCMLVLYFRSKEPLSSNINVNLLLLL